MNAMIRAALTVLAVASSALALVPVKDTMYSNDASLSETRLFEEQFRTASQSVRQNCRLFIAVYMNLEAPWKADFIRNTSMSALEQRFGGLVDMKFVVGTNEIAISARRELMWRQKRYGDYLLLDIPEGYDLLTGKTSALLQWVANEDTSNSKYILKADDDSFVHVQDLLDFLDSNEASELSENTVYGLLRNQTKVLHFGDKPKFRRWFEPDYDQEYYPLYADGGGYVFTRNLARMLGRQYYDVVQENQYHNEDASFGIWTNIINSTINSTIDENPEAKKQLIHYRSLPMWKFRCRSGDIINGDVDIRQFHCFYRKEQQGWTNRCCSRIHPRYHSRYSLNESFPQIE